MAACVYRLINFVIVILIQNETAKPLARRRWQYVKNIFKNKNGRVFKLPPK